MSAKLIKRTFFYTLLGSIPVFIVGSIFCYFMIRYINHEETDEFLTYEMERLVAYHSKHSDLPDYSRIADLLPDTRYETPVFKDSLLLETGDNEMVPYRELRFSLEHNDRYFTIVLRQLLLGYDDIAQGTLLIILGLALLFTLSFIVIINVVSGRLWKPFYQTLNTLTNYKISEPVPVFDTIVIDEFQSLNDTITILLRKIASDYQNNKEFNENASHELQTHLAIIRTNAEALLNKISLPEIQKIYSAATYLSQIQKSLLLLSKINNHEFTNLTQVDMTKLLNKTLENFSEVIQLRNLTLTVDTEPCIIWIDSGLASILMENLIKNAIKHNIDEGFIKIALTENKINIENSGLPNKVPSDKLFYRFVKGFGEGSGIGLAIVKQICDLYGFSISYNISAQSCHLITIMFKH